MDTLQAMPGFRRDGSLLMAVFLGLLPAKASASACDLSAPGRIPRTPFGAGARAPGMGGAFSALADDAYAAFYNPAGLAQLERPELGLAYSRLHTGLSGGSDLGTSQMVHAQPFARGKGGVLAASWDRFARSNLYTEQALGLSYGRRALSLDSGGELMAGLSGKHLQRSNDGRGAFDAGLGLVYRTPLRFQIGLAVDNVLEPHVGFPPGDRAARAYRAGLAYRSLSMSLSGETRLQRAPDGGTDRDFLVGAERIFPSLHAGQFAVRAGLGVGSREWREISVGGGCRAARLQVDYAFLKSVGAARGRSDSHRLSIGFRFGSPVAEDELERAIPEKASPLRRKPPPVAASKVESILPDSSEPFVDDESPQDSIEELLHRAEAAFERGDQAAAEKWLQEALFLEPENATILERLGSLRYVQGRPQEAAAYWERAKPLENRPEQLKALAEYLARVRGAGRPAAATEPADSGAISDLYERAIELYARGEQLQATALFLRILQLDPENESARKALERLSRPRLRGRP